MACRSHHHIADVRALGADHDAVGPLEVLDDEAFAQEVRIGHDGEIGTRVHVANDLLDIIAGPDSDSGFVDEGHEAVKRGGDGLGRRIDIGKVGMAVAAPRGCAKADEHHVSVLHRRAWSVVKDWRPCLTFLATSSSSPGS